MAENGYTEVTAAQKRNLEECAEETGQTNPEYTQCVTDKQEQDLKECLNQNGAKEAIANLQKASVQIEETYKPVENESTLEKSEREANINVEQIKIGKEFGDTFGKDIYPGTEKCMIDEGYGSTVPVPFTPEDGISNGAGGGGPHR